MAAARNRVLRTGSISEEIVQTAALLVQRGSIRGALSTRGVGAGPVAAAFMTDTYGKKHRDRPPAREVGRRESARMDFEDRPACSANHDLTARSESRPPGREGN